MLQDQYPFYRAGKPVHSDDALEVCDKYTGAVVSRVALASQQDIDQSIAAAVDATESMRRLPSYAKRDILHQCADEFERRSDIFTHVLCVEAGKPKRDATVEVDRLVETFRVAAEEATRIVGEVLPMDVTPRTVGYRGQWKRIPIGPCSFITPFNFPLNLVAHKIAPAIAAGCPFVLKPAELTPISAILIGEVLAGVDLPEGSWSILPCLRDRAASFSEDERLKLLSFTGSPGVGWMLKARAGKKKVVLELGGNAACIIDQDADIEDAATRVAAGGFAYAGQTCISVQRVIVHEAIADAFVKQLVSRVSALALGDPKDAATNIGPMISTNEADRLQSWIHEAIDAGAKLVVGGGCDGVMHEPTILRGVPRDLPLSCSEAFGPVVVVSTFADFDDALARVNDSAFGLQAGVFTRDLHKMNRAWDTLDVGGVMIGDVPSWRADHMPYGGVKDSGFGREGLRWAIEDMTELRMLVIRDAPPGS